MMIEIDASTECVCEIHRLEVEASVRIDKNQIMVQPCPQCIAEAVERGQRMAKESAP